MNAGEQLSVGPQAEVEPGEVRFEHFVASRYQTLRRFAHAVAGNVHDGDDLLQEGLVRLGIRWGRVVRDGDPEPYLKRTIVNLNVSRWRRKRSEVLAPPPDVGGEDTVPDPELWAAIAALPARQRTVLVLRYFEDMSCADTADMLGCSVGTVKSQTAKAISHLRRAIPAPLDWSE